MKKFLSLSIAIILTLTCLLLTACVPNKPDKAVKKLEKNGYTATLTESQALLNAEAITFGLEVNSITAKVYGINGGSIVTIYYCADLDTADALEDILDDLNDYNENIEVEQSGKKVIVGTEQGIKAVD